VTVDGKDALCRRMYPRQDRGEWRVDRLAGESQVLTEGLRLELPDSSHLQPVRNSRVGCGQRGADAMQEEGIHLRVGVV
jgi:phage tail protein X